MPLLHIIYASTSGHTEYVVDALIGFLKQSGAPWQIEKKKAEQSAPEDLLKGDGLLLAASTWNTGGIEGQLNPHMYVLLKDKAKDIDLKGKKIALIALGDHRYHYTVGAAKHLEEFVSAHHGSLMVPTLKIVNEPYGQEKLVTEWGEGLLHVLSSSAKS